MKLVKETDPILHHPVDMFDFESGVDVKKVAQEMYDFMVFNNGIGLSANQVGLPYRMFVMHSTPMTVCINPRITVYGEEEVVLDEGCLSYPGLFVKVKRPKNVRVRYQNVEGEWEIHKFSGMTSRVFQHELDHLEGVDFTTRVGRTGLKLAKQKVKKNLKKQKRYQQRARA